MLYRIYTVRGYADQAKFFKQETVKVIADYQEYQDTTGWGTGRHDQGFFNVGTIKNVLISSSGCLHQVMVAGSPAPELLEDLATHIEVAGGKLFIGNARIYGKDAKRKPKAVK